MKKIVLICIFAAILVAALCCALPSGAFDGNDYGGGGGDYGGGDYGGGWDSDSGSGSWGGGGVFEDILWGLFFAIIVFLFVYSFFASKKTKKGGAARPGSNQGLHITLPDRTAEIENIIRARDPNFSASDFVSFVKRVYIDIQTAWCKRDLSPVRILLHDNLYDATDKQIRAKIEQGVIYHYESMVVNTAYITSYAKDGQFEYATLYLNARMIDWQEDEKTGKILRGDKTTRWDLRYKMKFMRSEGVLTKEADEGLTGHKCPNCGAPLEAMSSGKCEYCDMIVTTGQYSWVLSDFGTIRDDTVDEGVKVN